MTPGWQQAETRRSCPHMGLLGAAFSIGRHDVGHVWKCVCGKEFVVVENAEGRKTLQGKI